MIVSPGHEQDGLFNMPCGQSGHFLSPFYRQKWTLGSRSSPDRSCLVQQSTTELHP